VGSNGGDTGAAGGEMEIAVAKPWPLDDAGTSGAGELPVAKPTLETSDDDTWRAASVGGRYADAAPSPAKESASAAAEEPEAVSSSDDAASGSSEGSTNDTSLVAADTAPPTPDLVVDTTSVQDSGGSEPPVFEAPAHEEPASEPNR
jgi:hypothetical protein